MKNILSIVAAAAFMSATGAYAQGSCGTAPGAGGRPAVCPAKAPAACAMNTNACCSMKDGAQCPMMRAKAQKMCPVMGGKISKKVYVDYNGKRVYFCCPGCVAAFKADPEKFVKKLTDAGVKLEDAPAAK